MLSSASMKIYVFFTVLKKSCNLLFLTASVDIFIYSNSDLNKLSEG